MHDSGEKKTFSYYATQFLNRNTVLLLFMYICDQLSLMMDIPMYSMLAGRHGLDAIGIGTIASGFFLANVCARPFAGIMTDTVRPKTLLIFVFFFKAVAFILLAISPTVFTFTLSRLLVGVVISFTTTVFIALMSHTVDRKAMGSAIGLLNGIPALVVFLMPSVGAHFFNTYSPLFAYSIAAAASIPGIIFAFLLKLDIPRLVDKSAKPTKFVFGDFITVKALPISFFAFFNSSLLFATSVILMPAGKEKGITGMAIFFTCYLAASAFAAIGGGVIGDVLKLKNVLVPSLILLGVSCVLLGAATTPFMVGLAGAVYAFSYQASLPVIRKGAALLVEPERRGASISTTNLVIDLCGITGSILPGFLAVKFGFTNAFYLMAIYPVVGLVYYFIVQKKLNAADEAARATEMTMAGILPLKA